MTLVLTTNKAHLVPMLLFAHKLRSCWCLHTNLTSPDYKIFLFFFTPPPREFSGGDASVPRSSALKGLISDISTKIVILKTTKLGVRIHRTPSEITVRIHRGVRIHRTPSEITVRFHRTPSEITVRNHR